MRASAVTASLFLLPAWALSQPSAQFSCGLSSISETVEPVYPAIASAAHIQGPVVLLVAFKSGGEVDTAKVVSGPEALRESAITYVLGWRANSYSDPRMCQIVIDFHIQQYNDKEDPHIVRLDMQHVIVNSYVPAAFPSPNVLVQGDAAQISTQSQAEEDTATKLPAFEVATIKPTQSGDGGFMFIFTAAGISVTGAPMQMILRAAFGVEDDRILGAPNWVKTDRYDIQAKVGDPDLPKLEILTSDQRKLMLLPLLVDRFNLKFHHETKELPAYALVIDKNGPKLQEAKPGDTYPNGIKGPDGTGGAGMWSVAHGKLAGQGVSIAALVHLLSLQGGLGRTIFDKTGLTGNYDFTIQWTPDDGPSPMVKSTEGGQSGNDNAPDTSGPSIFTAVQEQLGLKLEPQKGPGDVIVIDQIERPSEN